MAKPNYTFEKRQKELAKKKKKEEKRLRKLDRGIQETQDEQPPVSESPWAEQHITSLVTIAFGWTRLQRACAKKRYVKN